MYKKIKSDIEDKMTLDWQGTRSFMRGLGYNDEDMKKPRIGIINTWNEMNPGHIHQKELAEAARCGIVESGGLPFLFYGVNLCDCVGGGKYVLPSRDLLVNEVELIACAHDLDALVMIGTCDKIIPGLLMAAGRIDIPSVILTGGYMKTAVLNGKYIDFIDIGSSISKVKNGEMSNEDFDEILNVACPGAGACGMMGTANTMAILSETIGMSLPGNSTTAARSDDLIKLSKEAGKKVMELWANDITPRKIITKTSITNAIKVCMAIGGSANTIIHVPAVATEAELDMECAPIYSKASCEVPLLVGIRPNGPYCMKDFETAGGTPALLNELTEFLDYSGITVTGKTMEDNIRGCKVSDYSIIHSVADPLDSDGGLILCKGNLVPEGAFIKQSAVPKKLHKYRGLAKVYNDPDDAIKALRSGEIEKGDVVFIIFQGVKAGPSSAYSFTTALQGSSLKDDVVTVTDGRLSGAAAGACFGYASPEAALRGPLCAVRNGDYINFDIEKRELNIELSDNELKKRISSAEILLKPKKGYLGIYQKCVGSILKGAVLSGDLS